MPLDRSTKRDSFFVSDGESEVMVIRRTDFFDILRKEHQLAVKLLWQFLGVLADRLADTSLKLDHAREELAEDITADIFDEDDDDQRTTLIMPPPRSMRNPPQSSS